MRSLRLHHLTVLQVLSRADPTAAVLIILEYHSMGVYENRGDLQHTDPQIVVFPSKHDPKKGTANLGTPPPSINPKP